MVHHMRQFFVARGSAIAQGVSQAASSHHMHAMESAPAWLCETGMGGTPSSTLARKGGAASPSDKLTSASKVC